MRISDWSSDVCSSDLDAFVPRAHAVDQPLRLPVQDLYRFDDRRIVVGRIESGRLAVGDRIRFAPLGREATVATLEAWRGDGGAHVPRTAAFAGERSEERRVGEEGGSTVRCRWSPNH